MQVLATLATLLFVVAHVSGEQPPQEVVTGRQCAVCSLPGHSVVEQPHVHQPAEVQPQQPQQAPASAQHYAPAGVIQVLNQAPAPGPQQYSSANSAEQYGKPESAAIPANYKPFGSWGLYIGGNPADGYYTNYYKALGNSADKQQVVSSVEQVGVKPVQAGPVGVTQASSFGPILKQAPSSYPFGAYADQVYPFDYYTPADLNHQSAGGPSVYASGAALGSPVQVGAQVYGAPVAAYGSEQPLVYAADHYSTKRMGAAKGPERTHHVQQQQLESGPAKGYQARYAYAQQYHYAPAQAPQVVAFPVPVGSQIVGSQPGTDGAYAPYGVHGYTRYAVKPTVVATSSEQYYSHGVHAPYPVYRQQQQAQPQPQHAVVQPLGYYGYPLSQLHYSQGSIVPAFSAQGASSSVADGPRDPNSQPAIVAASPAGPIAGAHQEVGVHEQPQQVGPIMAPGVQIEAAGSEKSETREKKEHKRA